MPNLRPISVNGTPPTGAGFSPVIISEYYNPDTWKGHLQIMSYLFPYLFLQVNMTWCSAHALSIAPGILSTFPGGRTDARNSSEQDSCYRPSNGRPADITQASESTGSRLLHPVLPGYISSSARYSPAPASRPTGRTHSGRGWWRWVFLLPVLYRVASPIQSALSVASGISLIWSNLRVPNLVIPGHLPCI